MNTLDLVPSLGTYGLWDEKREDTHQKIAESLTRESMSEWADAGTQVFELPGRSQRRFRGFVSEDGDPNLVMAHATEFANGTRPQGYLPGTKMANYIMWQARHAQLMAEAELGVRPQVSVLFGDIIGQRNLRFSRSETRRVKNGDMSPYARRFKAMLGKAAAIGVGASAAETVMTGTVLKDEIDFRGLVVIESPRVIERLGKEDERFARLKGKLALAGDFFGSSGGFNDMIEASGIPPEDAFWQEPLGVSRYLVSGLLLPSNRAMLSVMQHGELLADLQDVREGYPDIAEVQAWSTNSGVSPANPNQNISETLAAVSPLHFGFQLEGNHTLPNVSQVKSALALHALHNANLQGLAS